MRAYPAASTPDPDGGFTVTFRDVPKAITDGDTRDEGLLRAEDALESALAMYVAAKEPLPTPSEPEADEVIVPLSVRDGENRIVRGNVRARRGPCRTRAPPTLAPAASQSRARPAPRFTDGTRGSRARRTRPAADRRRGTSGVTNLRRIANDDKSRHNQDQTASGGRLSCHQRGSTRADSPVRYPGRDHRDGTGNCAGASRDRSESSLAATAVVTFVFD
jgi:predicted RNase H-like HicB family nuclease